MLKSVVVFAAVLIAAQSPTSPPLNPSGQNQLTVQVTTPPTPWHWYEKVAWGANLLLLGVGAAGVYLANGTLRKIKRQTDLQGAAMKQWVELTGWESRALGKDGDQLEIMFSLVNPTNYLIRLNYVEVSFKPTYKETFYLVRAGIALPPNQPHPVDVRLPITMPRRSSLFAANLGVLIQLTIRFIDALNEEITQECSGLLSCSFDKTTLQASIKLDAKAGKGMGVGK